MSTVPDQLYKPLQRWQTRILRLHPAQNSEETLQADLLPAGLLDGNHLAIAMDEPPINYEAVSYTWGEQSNDKVPILCNGISSEIQPSLGRALKQFRLSDRSRWLWADALCINQSDDEEKNSQVANMFKIYNKAQRVLVWLGEAGPGLGDSIDFAKIAGILNGSVEDCIADPRKEEALHALMQLSCHPWTRRVWIQQEIFAARDCLMFCGRHELTLTEFKTLVDMMSVAASAFAASGLNSPEPRSWNKMIQALSNLHMATEKELLHLEEQRIDNHISSHMDMTESLRNKDTPKAFFRALTNIRNLATTDERDFVYAILNMTECPVIERYQPGLLGICIDYKLSASRVFQDATMFIMNRDRGFGVLEYYTPAGIDSTSALRLPSWTIDWRQGYDADYDPWVLPSTAWTWLSPNAEGTIVMPGILLATIRSVHVSWNGNSAQSGDIDFASIQLCAQSHVLYCQQPPERHHLHWDQQGVSVSHEGRLLGQRECQKLDLIRAGDILVSVESFRGHLAYLRPHRAGKLWSFVTAVEGEQHLRLIAGDGKEAASSIHDIPPGYIPSRGIVPGEQVGNMYIHFGFFSQSKLNVLQSNKEEFGRYEDFIIC